jgi:glycosyltransferase involved in cell wall biosynthesis
VRIACLNQDPGISPARAKGAAVHLREMRRAFQAWGAEVSQVDDPDAQRARNSLAALQAEHPLDLVYERFSLASETGARFASEHGIPYVLEVNTPLTWEEERYRGGSVDTAVLERERLVFSSAALVVAVSSQVAEYARERGAAGERVHVFANGVDLERFRPRGAGDPLRSSLVPGERFALLFHGRLRPWHGFDRLVQAAAQALERGADLHVVTVGEGDFESELARGLPRERWTRVGWVDHEDMPRHVAVGDCQALSYPPDAPCYFSPLKLAEAMACGVVPVVPRLGDLEQVVSHDRNGLVYPAEALDQLVDAIVRLASDSGLRERLARGALATAEELSWKRIAGFVLENACNGAGR